MQFIKQGKQARSWWREKRLADEAFKESVLTLNRFVFSGTLGLFSVATLILHGLMIALPFVILAAFIYLRK